MIAYFDLRKALESYRDELQTAFNKVVSKGMFVLDEEVEMFEHRFAEYCGSKFCIGVSSGVDALTLSLIAWKEQGKLSIGDSILVPAHTYIATFNAVLFAGMKPVPFDISRNHFLPDKSTLPVDPGRSCKAIIPVHLYGSMCNMQIIKEYAEKHNLLILEDAAQAHGASCSGIMAGNWGNAAAFSFYPGKNLGALGDGGAITSNDTEFAEIIRTLRNNGSAEKFKHSRIGGNHRLDEMQAAFLNLRLERLEEENIRRRKIAAQYLSNIRNPNVILPDISYDIIPVWHVFPVLVKDQEHFRQYMIDKGIQTHMHYPIPPHLQIAYKKMKWDGLFPNTESYCTREVSIPLHPFLSSEETEIIIQAVNAYENC